MDQPVTPQWRKFSGWIIAAATALVSVFFLLFQNGIFRGSASVEPVATTETGSAGTSPVTTSNLPTPLPDLDTFLQSLPQTATPLPGAAIPARIEIEAAQIDVLVLTVTLDSNGFVSVPDRYAGYWGLSSPLDNNGNTVIVGHNRLEPRPIFRGLTKVNKGDQIRVTDQFGVKRIYVVTDTLLFRIQGGPASEANRPREYALPTTSARLTLITCTPDDSCIARLIILAEPIDS